MKVDETLNVIRVNSFEQARSQKQMFFDKTAEVVCLQSRWACVTAKRVSALFFADKCLGQVKRKLQEPGEGISRSSSVTFLQKWVTSCAGAGRETLIYHVRAHIDFDAGNGTCTYPQVIQRVRLSSIFVNHFQQFVVHRLSFLN